MLIQCSLVIQDSNTQSSQMNARPLRSAVFTKKLNGKYYVCVKNSRFPNTMSFDVVKLKNIYCKFIEEKRLGLEFRDPKKMLLIVADNKKMLYLFYQQLKNILNGKNVTIGLRHNIRTVKLPAQNITNRFNPMSLEFVAVDSFDNRILNLRYLNKLVLENCNLPKMPVQLGQLPIKYLSISGSKLATSKFDQDTFWNWMSTDTICETLTTLKMNSVGLKSLPFEIMFLKNLQTLYAAKNLLTYLPHFIAEIKKLQNLFVADNMLLYFPYISFKTFKELDISNNIFELLPESPSFNHLRAYMDVFESLKRPDNDLVVKPLSHLSFYSLIYNCVPFKRQDIPRTLWLYFDVVGRCIRCNKCILPDYSEINYSSTLPHSMILTRDHRILNVPQQYLSCRIICGGS